MTDVAIAACSPLAADAGAHVAEIGGNAVDAAIASILVAGVTEPGIVSLGGGAFVTLRSPEGEQVVIDGYVEMPGREASDECFGRGGRTIETEYAGGVTTVVGHGSVAVPGMLAALEEASERYGRVPWKTLFEPALDVARDGFCLGAAASHYLSFVHDLIFGWHPESHAAVHDENGKRLEEGDRVVIANLADSLELLAEEGVSAFYEGDLARAITADMDAHGGLLGAEDLRTYRPVLRAPLETELDGWSLATNPPPAVGGVALAGMLNLMHGYPKSAWDAQDVARLVRVQRAVLGYRREHLDGDDLAAAAERLLTADGIDELDGLLSAPSTVNSSAVDANGGACAISASSGYGSGVIAPGTGIWLNNCLGETELNPGGFHTLVPGQRLTSNMAPTVASSDDGDVLAVGSPGADRITTALLTVLLTFVRVGTALDVAVAHPRLHVDVGEQPPLALHEDGLAVEAVEVSTRAFGSLHMMFGGVTAALRSGRGLTAAADPRRTGGTAVAGRASSDA